MILLENLKLFFKLYVRPLAAFSDLIDQGNWLLAALFCTGTAVLFTFTVTERIYQGYEAAPIPAAEQRVPPDIAQQAETDPEVAELLESMMPRTQRLPLPLVGNWGWRLVSFNARSMLSIALSLAALYVPGLILALVLITRTSSFSIAFRRDYGSLLVGALMAWAASHLPFALAGRALGAQLPPDGALLLWLLSSLYFGLLMMCALRTMCGASWTNALLAVGVAWIALRFDSWLYSIATFSPFFTLIWLAPLLLGALYGVRAAHLQRQSFRRYLESCTINERDAEAHYQLGLIYQQRRQYKQAAARFKRAVEVDPKEPDANFELGRLARQESRLQEAINHFSVVVAHDDKFRQSEIWREIGATYLAAGMLAEAQQALSKYFDRRPYDPEGLYHYAETLRQLGDSALAQSLYRQCIEAVKTMPYYRRNEVNQWRKLAESKLS